MKIPAHLPCPHCKACRSVPAPCGTQRGRSARFQERSTSRYHRRRRLHLRFYSRAPQSRCRPSVPGRSSRSADRRLRNPSAATLPAEDQKSWKGAGWHTGRVPCGFPAGRLPAFSGRADRPTLVRLLRRAAWNPLPCIFLWFPGAGESPPHRLHCRPEGLPQIQRKIRKSPLLSSERGRPE